MPFHSTCQVTTLARIVLFHTHMHQNCKISRHSLSSTSQLSMTVDTTIRIVWHSAEVAHFTHKIREAFVSSTTPQYLKYSGEAPDHYLSLDVTNIGSTSWYTALVYKQKIVGLCPFHIITHTRRDQQCVRCPVKTAMAAYPSTTPSREWPQVTPVTSNVGTMLVSA